MCQKNAANNSSQLTRLWRRDLIGLGLVWSLLLAVSCWWNLAHEERRVEEMVRVQARTAHYKDVVYRFWNSAHGWVYVPIDESTPPNPYLSEIPERDITTPSGKKLTLMNPAYMTRQAHELEENQLGIKGHLTSLIPLRPENKPDPWEEQALKRFEQGETEVSSVELIDNEAFMRLMRPLLVDDACMRCHASQGYTVGQIRGGISVSVAMAPTLALVKTSKLKLIIAHLLYWLMGMAGIFMRASMLKRREEDRIQSDQALRAINENLERHVDQRTQALKQSETRLIDAQAIARIGNWDWDILQDSIHCSEEIWRIFGLSAPPQSESLESYLDLVHPDDQRQVKRMLNRVRKDGGSFRLEHRIIRPDGSEHVVQIKARTTRDTQGRTLHLTGTLQDISERVQAAIEAEKLTVQLRQAQKFETIGTLAGGIAHDFNNILMPISGYTELAQKDTASAEDRERYLKQVQVAAERGKGLVRQILTFSRKAEQIRRPLQLSSIVEEALQLLRSSLPSTIMIKESYQADCCAISADPGQIHQVIMNLCTNAYQAMREQGGTLSISLAQTSVGEDSPLIGPTLPSAGPYVHLSVCDSGPGMDSKTLERIFEPFFTTKQKAEGTGLGLAVVYGIVHAHQGGISVISEPGAGSCFHIYLPATDEVSVAPVIEEKFLRKRHERILLVDDETGIVNLLNIGLEQAGFRVSGFHSSPAALAAFQDQPENFDLLLTDQTMPELTGLQLAKEAWRIRPDLPVVILTGDGSEEQRAEALESGVTEYLVKPLTPMDLIRALSRLFSTGE